MRLIDLLAASPNKDPVSVGLALGGWALMRWLAGQSAAEMARNLAEAYKPEGIP